MPHPIGCRHGCVVVFDGKIQIFRRSDLTADPLLQVSPYMGSTDTFDIARESWSTKPVSLSALRPSMLRGETVEAIGPLAYISGVSQSRLVNLQTLERHLVPPPPVACTKSCVVTLKDSTDFYLIGGKPSITAHDGEQCTCSDSTATY